MSVPYVNRAVVSVSDDEILKDLKKRKLPKTAINIASARNRLTAEKEQDALPKGHEVSVIRSDAPRQIIYGETIVGGVITFAAMSNNNQQINLIVTFAGHEVESIEEIYLDDCRVDFPAVPGWCSAFVAFDGGVYYNTDVYLEKNLGAEDQEALASMVAENVGWTTDHRQQGCAHIGLKLKWNANLFGDGLPKIRALIKGRKVYDPRLGYKWYTANAVLCTADWLTDARYSSGAATTRVYNASLTEAANVCDEVVETSRGGTEYRYTINGSFEATVSPDEVLKKMANATGGRIEYSQGQWTILPAKWRAPALELGLGDLLGEMKIDTSVSRRELFNRVRGTFSYADQRHASVTYPVVTNAFYLSQDQNDELWLDLNQDFVTSSPTCQRLAKIELERIRQSLQYVGLFGLKAYQLKVGETVNLTIPDLGWSSKTFEVADVDFVEGGDRDGATLGVQLTLRETASGIFDWNAGNETTHDISPNTNLPSPLNVPGINNLVLSSGTSALYQKADGTVVSRLKAEWDAVTDGFVVSGGKLVCEFKKTADTKWRSFGELSPETSEVYIWDVADLVAYDFRICCRNALGLHGAWTTAANHLVLGKQEKPSDVTGFVGGVASFGITLDWEDIADLDLAAYEVREGASWGTASYINSIRSSKIDLPIRAAGTHTFLVKAIDTSKLESINPASCSVVISGPTVSSPIAAIDGTEMKISWSSAPGSFSIEDYLIKEGTTYEAGTLLGTVKGTTFRLGATWSGNKQLWIAAKDVAGNVGTAVDIFATIVPPGLVQSPTTEVVDNFVMFRWSAPSVGSLAVRGTKIYKVVGGSDTLIGESSGTFLALMETEGGTYTYRLAAVDLAGNEGDKRSITAVVSQPRDYVFKSSNALDPDDATTKTNIAIANNIITLPIDTSETYQQHFDNRSWATPQAQVDAGYSIVGQPTPSTAQYIQTLDLGATIGYGCLVTLALAQTDTVAGLTLTPTISVSLDGSSWTDYVNKYQIYTSNFRYVKITIDASGGGTAAKEIQEVRVTVSKQDLRDSGGGYANSSDSGGTTVAFNKTFVDIESLIVTAKYQAGETKGITAVYDFTDIANPTGFKVLLYSNNTGSRISGDFSWNAGGS